MPVVQPRGWLEYYMILITKVCARLETSTDRWPFGLLARRSSFHPARPLVYLGASRHGEVQNNENVAYGLI